MPIRGPLHNGPETIIRTDRLRIRPVGFGKHLPGQSNSAQRRPRPIRSGPFRFTSTNRQPDVPAHRYAHTKLPRTVSVCPTDPVRGVSFRVGSIRNNHSDWVLQLPALLFPFPFALPIHSCVQCLFLLRIVLPPPTARLGALFCVFFAILLEVRGTVFHSFHSFHREFRLACDVPIVILDYSGSCTCPL